MQIYEIWAFLKDLVWIELMAWKCAPRLFFMKRKELYKYLTLIIFQGRTYEIYKYSPLRYTTKTRFIHSYQMTVEIGKILSKYERKTICVF